jgi:steroid delta-isomerase-like uncharacterized protein
MASDIKETIQRFYEEVLNQGRLDVLNDVLASGFVDHTPSGVSHADGAGLRQQIEAWRRGFPDLRVKVDEIIAEDTRLAVRMSWEGTHQENFMGVPATGRRIAAQAVDILYMKDDRITEAWHYGNEALASRLRGQ